jgi:hypothetical protein
MAEKGFLSFEEAAAIYQPADPKDLQAQAPKSFGPDEEDMDAPPLPLYPMMMLKQGLPFTDALQEIDSTGLLERIQGEFVSLCNQIISADQKKIQAREALQSIVEKACGYLNIGLEANFEDDVSSLDGKAAAMAALVQHLPLSQIFRFGYGRALALKWRVERWRKNAWFETSGLPVTFWDEKWLGVMGGLLIDKPLFFDNYRTGNTLYREFKSLQDIRTTERTLAHIMGMDTLLAGMSIQCRPEPGHLLTWKNLVLTLWARFHLGLDPSSELDSQGRLKPLSKTEFTNFFKTLFSLSDSPDESRPGKTGKDMKIGFLNWFSGRSAKSSQEITETLGPVLDALFEQVDTELGNIRSEDIDPRFIHLFRVGR